MPDDTQREKRNREAGPMVIIAGYVLVDEGQRDAYVEARTVSSSASIAPSSSSLEVSGR